MQTEKFEKFISSPHYIAFMFMWQELILKMSLTRIDLELSAV
jgi:hypothetical protein